MLDKFCLDGFWNKTLFTYPQYPMFTTCFQYSLLLIPPGIFDVLFILFIFFKMYNDQKIIKIPFDIWYVIKLGLQGLLIISLIIEITLERWVLKLRSEIDGVYVLCYTFLCLTMILVMLQTEIRRRAMHPSCPILFTFWSTGSLAYLIRFYSNVIRVVQIQKTPRIIDIGFVSLSGIVLFLFILNLIIDSCSRYSPERLVTKKKMPCPEEYASVISKLTYSWLDKYIYRWFKEEMTDETSFDLRRSDESNKNTNFIERRFLEIINKDKDNKKDRSDSNDLTLSTANLLGDDNEIKVKSKFNPGLTLFCCMLRTYASEVAIAWTFKVIHDLSIFGAPFLLKIVLQYIKDTNNSYWIGYCLAFAFLFAGMISTLGENGCFFIVCNLSIRIRAAIIGMVYRKTLRLNNEVRGKFTSGEIVNLMSVDAERIMNWVVFSWFVISCPLQIILAIVLLYKEMSYAIFAGLGLVVIFFPVNGAMMTFTHKYSEIELTWKDKRVKILTEILNGIKVLKMYAWEKSFISKVTQLRDTEMKYIFRVSASWGIFSVLWEILPFLVMLVSFLTYVFMDKANVVTAEKAFVSLTLFNLMRFPMVVLPWCITNSINAFVSLKRIGEYLLGEELDETGISRLDDTAGPHSKDDIVVEIRDGSFSWKKDEKVILNKIDLEVHRGKLIAIVGKVGTGKSSLISAMLGEMHRITGSTKIQGKMAYVPQEAWIQNKSLKANILFTETYNETFYNNIIEACALTSDLEQLPGKDETEIGERGINLSGGQKQRVSLARAVYQNRDIYLLDDPLSAVDAHVGQHLFEKVISNNGILKGKTRILITHGLNWLPRVDKVFVLDSNGCISERGTFKELLKNGDVFMQFVQEYMEHNNRRKKDKTTSSTIEDDTTMEKAKILLKQVSETEEALEEFTELVLNTPPKRSLSLGIDIEESKNSDQRLSVSPRGFGGSLPGHSKICTALESEPLFEEATPSKPIRKAGISRQITNETISSEGYGESDKDCLIRPTTGQLTDEEQVMTGTVKWRTYGSYIKSRGLILFVTTSLIYAGYIALQVFNNIWLQRFTEDSLILNASSEILKNSSNIPAMSAIIRERTKFYMSGYTFIGMTMVIVVCVYWFAYTIGSVKASKVIHKNLLNAILRSAMEFFDTTPSGRILNRFSKDIETIDHVLSMTISDALNCFFMVLSSIAVIIYVTPWFAVLTIPLAVFYYLIQLFYMPSSRQSRRLNSIASSPIFNNFTETLQGVAVIRAFTEQRYFRKLNQSLVDRSNKFKFIQNSSNRWLSFRIDTIGNLMVFATVLFAIIDRGYLSIGLAGLSISYSLQITDNLNWLLRQYTNLETNFVSMERIREYSMVPSEAEWDKDNDLPESWPDSGDVTFRNYDLRYREGLPLVLKDINLRLNGGEKIGVVGRTGAGKSSLNLALFRLVEPAGGVIQIDGVDISTLGLHNLRKKLTILPQDPVIFSGTVRDNLDPFGQYTEDELFQSLETAHLKQWVSSLTEGIEYDCGEGGSNLSVGQKQLLCLGRALLRKSKVLILDEATASVDVETDRLVMDTIRDYFRSSTVIIIAHRINTILDTDKIVVMDNGQIAEMDTPNNLMDIPNGIFRSLHEQSSKHDL